MDFINKFGDLGGFDRLLARFLSAEPKMTIAVIVALLKPWGFCYEYLSQATVKKYFAPILVRPSFSIDEQNSDDLLLGNHPSISRSTERSRSEVREQR